MIYQYQKDYLTYNADFHGKSWLDNDLWIRSHIEGVFTKPRFRVTTKLNPETGEHLQNKEFDGTEDEYYVELTNNNRKKQIEEIINKCNGTLIEEIKFYYHVPSSVKGESFRCDQYTYDQFINSSLDELETLARKQGGPQGNAPYASKDKKIYIG